jgi:hypothetical protein
MCCRASSQAHTYRFAERHYDEAPVGASTDDNSDNHVGASVSPLPGLVCMLSAFRAQIVKDSPNLCSDSLPLEGPIATLPKGQPYGVIA